VLLLLEEIHRGDPAPRDLTVAYRAGVDGGSEQAIHLLLERLKLAGGLQANQGHLKHLPRLGSVSDDE